MHPRNLLLFALAASLAPAASPVVVAPQPVVEPAPPSDAELEAAREDCVASTLCALKPRIGQRGRPWTPRACRTVAAAVIDSAARHDLSPALLLAVMINESDLDEKAARTSLSKGRVAKDSGLMGIRCVLGRRRDTCSTGLVRGMPWRTVMDPVTNVELGAQYLAHYRDTGRTRHGRCRHRDHAWWAHYNHGTRYISHGPARDYPHHVATLYGALAQTLSFDDAELRSNPSALRGATSARHNALASAIRAAGSACVLPTTYAAAGGRAPARL